MRKLIKPAFANFSSYMDMTGCPVTQCSSGFRLEFQLTMSLTLADVLYTFISKHFHVS